MSMVSAGSPRGWRVAQGPAPSALEVVLLDRTYVLPWSQFLYAEGGEDEVRIVFATHDIVAKGAGLQQLLTDVAAQRVVSVDEPTRSERFSSGDGGCIREVAVHQADS